LLTSKLVNALEPKPAGTFACERICEDHAREARLIQSSLLPTKGLCHEIAEVAFRFIPFFDVGGDFADFFVLPDGLIGI